LRDEAFQAQPAGEVRDLGGEIVDLLGLVLVVPIIRYRDQRARRLAAIDRPRAREKLAQIERRRALLEHHLARLVEPHLAARLVPDLVDLGLRLERVGVLAVFLRVIRLHLVFEQLDRLLVGEAARLDLLARHVDDAPHGRDFHPVARERVTEVGPVHEFVADPLAGFLVAVEIGLVADPAGTARREQAIVAHAFHHVLNAAEIERRLNARSRISEARRPTSSFSQSRETTACGRRANVAGFIVSVLAHKMAKRRSVESVDRSSSRYFFSILPARSRHFCVPRS
jgi:hypothetical protein